MWTLEIHKNDKLVFMVLTEFTCQPSVQCECLWAESSLLLLFSRSVVSDSVTPWTVAHPGPLSMGFSRQEYWSGLPFPFPGDLSDPGIKPTSLTLAGRFFTNELPGKTPTPLSQGYWPALCLFCGSWDGNHSRLPAPPQLSGQVGSSPLTPHHASPNILWPAFFLWSHWTGHFCIFSVD